MKKDLIIVGAAVAAVFSLMTASGPASAANDYCGASGTGCEHAAAAGAQCGSGAASGAFGAFGKDNNFKGGANGQATGDANSAICGNKDGTKFD